jgi:type III secretory pathway lipoprotein EscJ
MPNSRILCQSLLVLAVLACGCKETILHDLSELQANQVRIVLSRSNISAEKVREGNVWSVTVPSSRATAALALLAEERVLKPRPEIEEDSNSFIQSYEERTRKQERSLAVGLEHTLERIPGILEARVHLHFSRERMLQLVPEQPKHSASVVLLIPERTKLDESHIQALVAGASGIANEDISVIAFESRVTSALVEDESPKKEALGAPAHYERKSNTAGGGSSFIDFAAVDGRFVLWLLPGVFVAIAVFIIRKVNDDRKSLQAAR